MANLPVPSPRSFAVSEVEAAGYLNSVRDALNFLLNPPLALLYQTVAQTVGSGGTGVLALDSTVADTYGGHSNVTNNSRYTAIVAGWYFVKGGVVWAVNATANRIIQITKNGVAVPQSWVAVLATTAVNAPGEETTALVFLNAGDYVEISISQNSGGNLNTFVTGPNPSMHIWWVHV